MGDMGSRYDSIALAAGNLKLYIKNSVYAR